MDSVDFETTPIKIEKKAALKDEHDEGMTPELLRELKLTLPDMIKQVINLICDRDNETLVNKFEASKAPDPELKA